MRLKVKNTISNAEFEVDGDLNETVGSLFAKIKNFTGPLPSICFLQYGSVRLSNNSTLQEAQIADGATLLIIKPSVRAYGNPYAASNPPQTYGNQPMQMALQIGVPRQHREYTIPWLNPKMLEPNPPSTPYFRFSTLAFPQTPEMMKAAGVPLGVVVRPADVSNQAVIDSSNQDLIVCTKCRCMLCPQVTFTPDMRSWICPACKTINPIMDMNRVLNAEERKYPVYDIMVKPLTNSLRVGGACFTFIIDLSAQAFALNFTNQFIYSIKASLPSMPDTAQINLITISDRMSYFDFTNNTEVILPDLSDPVYPSNLIPWYLGDIRDYLNAAFDNLLTRNGQNNAQGHCIGDAYRLAVALMPNGGNIIAGFVGIPTQGRYPLKIRTITAERTETDLLKLPPDETSGFYKNIPFVLNRSAISLHVFNAGKQYADLATDAVATGLTGGSCHHYHLFDQEDRMQLHADVFKILTKQYLWDATLAFKSNPNMILSRAHGNCSTKTKKGINTSFAVLQTDDSLVLELDFQEKVEGPNLFIQVQLMFTNDMKQQMIRVFSFSVPFAQTPQQIVDNIDEAALLGILIRKTTTSVLGKGAVASSNFLKETMRSCITHQMPLVSLPYMLHSMLCNDLVAPQHPDGVDGRLALVIKIRSIDIITLMLYLYPRFFVFTETGEFSLLPLTGSSFGAGNCFVVHCFDKIVIWVNNNASQPFLEDVFGVSDISQISPELPETGGPLNTKLFELINESRIMSGCYLPVIAIPQGSPSESIFQNILVDDKKGYGMNYQEFINSF